MTFTNEQVTKAIKEVVAEKGEDHVYEAEQNTPHKQAAKINYSYDDCIVGCVIQRLDPELHAEVLEYERIEPTGFAFGSHRGSATGNLYAAFTEKQVIALREAQAQQDAGHNWGEALKSYTETIGASND